MYQSSLLGMNPLLIFISFNARNHANGFLAVAMQSVIAVTKDCARILTAELIFTTKRKELRRRHIVMTRVNANIVSVFIIMLQCINA